MARITEAHHQARRTIAVVLGFAVASPVAVLVPHRTGGWLPLHLFLVGSLLSAIVGITQYLAVTWSGAPAPGRRASAAQRWVLGGGVVAVAAGRELRIDVLIETGAAAVILALGLVSWALIGIRRRGTTPRFRPAIDAYLLAIAWSVVGVALGVALATGRVGSGWTQVRAIHLAVNVFGLVGLVLAGTVPFFFATQMRAKMSTRATPERIRLVTLWLALSLVVVVAGYLGERPGLSAAGYGGYALGLATEIALLPSPKRRSLAWAGPRLLHLAAGWLWWIATTVALAVHEMTGGLDADRILAALVVGGFAQMLVGSLAYLGPVLRNGGHEMLTAGFALTRSWTSLVAANLAAVGLVSGVRALATVGLAIWVVDILQRSVRLVSAGGGVARPRPAG